MDLVVIICVVFMVTFGEAVKILVADNGITGLSQTWQTQGNCDASWRWENGAWVSCHTARKDYEQNCYLDSTAWPTEMANMIYLNITVAVTSCNVAPQLPKCIESIEVYVRKKLASSGNEIKSRISTVPFRVAPISNDSSSFMNADTIAIQELNDVSDVYLQFQAAYTCIKVIEVLLFYYDCPAVTNELLTFPQERAPNETVGTVKIEGVCVQNAAPVSGSSDDNILSCRYDGTYSVSGSCHCMKGHTKSSSKCEVCADHKYKNTTGNHPCSSCGTNTEKGPQPRTFCLCLKGYFRAYANRRDDASDCYRPPDEPVNVIVTDIKSDSVHISWKEPKVPESNPLGIYVIECTNCPKQHSVFPIKTKKLELNITGLGAFANYSLTVANENNITNLTREKNYAAVEFQTRLGKPGVILHFKYVTNNDGSVTLTWSPPFVRGGPDLVYVIEYGGNTETTSERSFTIKTGTQDKTYSVKIYAQVTFQGKTIRGDPYVESIRVKGGISLTVAIGASVGVIIFVVIVLVLVFCYWRRTHPSYLQVVRMEDGRVKLPGRMFPGGKLYVDPTTYNDVDDAVQEFAYELDRKDVKMGELLGGGEFAEVYKGSLFRNGKSCDVAVKTLKAGASKRDRDDFLGEAAILGQFADPNVVGLEGVILKERPNIIVLEFMKNGALDKYLQVNDMQFTVLQLLGMARGVASGMKYLSELGFIHRDLAARNILVDEHKVCKVSDFGMSREIKVDETYDTQGGKIPVRWTAPEAIQFKKFTTSSDVWSYGVLLWEIMSYGERPYWDWGNYEVLERLNAGYRLPPPMSCPKVIHDFMLHCWNRDRTKRPKFGESRDQLEKWIRNPDLLQEIASVITKTDENLDYTVLQTIHKWLEAIGMSRYTNNFIEQGFATPRQILDLTLEDLEALGIAPIGHRKKVYKAIQNTKIQVEARHNSAAGRRKTASVSKK